MYLNSITMFGACGYYPDSVVKNDTPPDPADSKIEANKAIEPSKASHGDKCYDENGANVKSK